ncbi:MAG: copper resistance CopC family protein [Nocardioides sp.]
MTHARALLGALLAGVLVLLTGAPATAHASLLSSDPAEGAVVSTMPEEVVLTFNEPVRLGGADAVRGFAPDGDDWPLEAEAQDNRVVVTPTADPGTGTVVVSWRVVSEDGHEISGALTFAIGEPSGGGAAAGAPGAPRGVEVAAVVAITVAVVSLGGLVVLAGVLVVRRTLPSRWTHRGTHHALSALWDVAFVAALLAVPLTELVRQGRGWAGLGDWLVWLDGLTHLRAWLLVGAVVVAAGLVTIGRRGSRPAHCSRTWAVLGVGTTVLVVALLGTAFAMDPGPETAAAASDATTQPQRQVHSTALGPAGSVELAVEPLEGRQVRLDVRLLDPDGEPLRPYAPPALSIASEEVDLGEPALRRTGPGEYRAVVTIPRDGEWAARVSVRVDEFDNPVVDLPFTIG